MLDLITLAYASIILLATGGVLSTFVGGPVTRQRVERFARRQRLRITVDNGNQVIRYLATTRRWRVAGFLGGFFFTAVTPPDGQMLEVDFVTLFVGWFLGALIAEVRVAHLAHGPLRAASLHPRRPGSYLSPVAWKLVPVAAITAVAVAAGTGVAAVNGLADPDWSAWVWLPVALALAGVIRAIQLQVLRRAQPHAAPDVLAADDAIRSRSLHVLSGGGGALVLFVVLRQLGVLHLTSREAEMVVEGVQAFGVFVVAAAGWHIATSIWPPPRPQPRATVVGA